MNIRQTTGTALRAGNSGRIIYTPPVGESVIRDKLANWGAVYPRESQELDPDYHGGSPLPI